MTANMLHNKDKAYFFNVLSICTNIYNKLNIFH
ncbi:hypothetical protein BCD_1690 (plasmid) [Borrelia crocidurae DOU]|uniref:Uncharacterized protein n=1 Tax=Borrelia crocidurae DOU TaxID=1293575 RepID=W5SRR2_9SPIR|nr:hypothetical protein BCD_1690 [Borrelia crocidurae DOU]